MTQDKNGLADLEANIRRDFEFLNYPPANWVKPVPGPGGEEVLDVAVIGGGMCGMAVAFGLRREGIANFRIFDASDKGFEGPWMTTARMRTLRSPKHLTGPHMGLPNLTFQAWHRAQWGAEVWEKLGYISRDTWMDYLRWYRDVLEIPVENNVRLEKIIPEGELLRLHLSGPAGKFNVHTRRLVLATGRAAFGGIRIPQVFKNIPKDYCAHTEEKIDFPALAGKRVLVVGGAASAVDNAAVALENNAAEAHLLIRAPEIPRLNKFKNTVYPGYFRGYSALDDETRWRFLQHGLGSRVAAPRLSMLRLKAYDNFHIHTGADVKEARVEDGRICLKLGQGEISGDFVILGTGYAIDARQQPELADFANQLLLWRDRYQQPPANIANEELGRFPYLGPAFELLEKEAGSAPYLNRIHLFNAATTLSHAAVSSDIPGVNIGVDRLVNALAARFFSENATQHLESFYAYEDPELFGDEWRRD